LTCYGSGSEECETCPFTALDEDDGEYYPYYNDEWSSCHKQCPMDFYVSAVEGVYLCLYSGDDCTIAD